MWRSFASCRCCLTVITVTVAAAVAVTGNAVASATETAEAEIVILSGSGNFTTRKLRFTEIFPTLKDALPGREGQRIKGVGRGGEKQSENE